MKTLSLKAMPVALLALASTSIAFAENSFQEAAKHLDTDGSFIAYMDFDGDGEQVGKRLNAIYQTLAAANPQVPPFPLDFPRLFGVLGFGSVRSMAASSTEVEDGLQRNRSIVLLEGEPQGLFSMYSVEPVLFRAAELAPADATTAISGRIKLTAFRETVINFLSEVMGPMGQGMAQQALAQPIAGSDVTGNELIDALSGRMDFIMSQSFENPQEPKMKLWLSMEGAGALVPRLESFFARQGISFSDSPAGRVADLSSLVQGAPFALRALVPTGTNDLTLYSDEGWVTGTQPESGLDDTPAFQRVVSRLPKEAGLYSYSSGFDVEQILASFEQDPNMVSYLPLIRDVVDFVAGDLLAPNASAIFRSGDALVTEQYAEYSFKSILVGIPAGIGVGIGAGAAIRSAMQQSAIEEDEYPEEEWDSEEYDYESEEAAPEEWEEGE